MRRMQKWSKCRLGRLNHGEQMLLSGPIPRPALYGSANLREKWPGTRRNHMPNRLIGLAKLIGACRLCVSLKHCWTEPGIGRLCGKRYLSGTLWATGHPQPLDPKKIMPGSWCSTVPTYSVIIKRTNIMYDAWGEKNNPKRSKKYRSISELWVASVM